MMRSALGPKPRSFIETSLARHRGLRDLSTLRNLEEAATPLSLRTPLAFVANFAATHSLGALYSVERLAVYGRLPESLPQLSDRELAGLREAVVGSGYFPRARSSEQVVISMLQWACAIAEGPDREALDRALQSAVAGYLARLDLPSVPGGDASLVRVLASLEAREGTDFRRALLRSLAGHTDLVLESLASLSEDSALEAVLVALSGLSDGEQAAGVLRAFRDESPRRLAQAFRRLAETPDETLMVLIISLSWSAFGDDVGPLGRLMERMPDFSGLDLRDACAALGVFEDDSQPALRAHVDAASHLGPLDGFDRFGSAASELLSLTALAVHSHNSADTARWMARWVFRAHPDRERLASHAFWIRQFLEWLRESGETLLRRRSRALLRRFLLGTGETVVGAEADIEARARSFEEADPRDVVQLALEGHAGAVEDAVFAAGADALREPWIGVVVDAWREAVMSGGATEKKRAAANLIAIGKALASVSPPGRPRRLSPTLEATAVALRPALIRRAKELRLGLESPMPNELEDDLGLDPDGFREGLRRRLGAGLTPTKAVDAQLASELSVSVNAIGRYAREARKRNQSREEPTKTRT